VTGALERERARGREKTRRTERGKKGGEEREILRGKEREGGGERERDRARHCNIKYVPGSTTGSSDESQ